MKKIILIIALLIAGVQSWAQSTINYKALVKESGTILISQTLAVQFTVYNGNPTSGGVQVYSEVHSTSTDANGIIILNIGSGSTSDNWNNIDWSLHNQFVKTEYNTGSGYTDMGTQSFMFVPYAKYAETAGNAFSGSYADLSGTPVNVSEFTNDAGYLTSFTEVDGSTTNEIQTLSVNSDQLSISGGNSVTLPTGTTYTAGTGISISGGVISNTGDTDASNDFSGNYEELAGTPVNFYIAGSGDYPTSITNNVYRDGGFALGFNNPTEGKLDVRQSGSGTTNADLTGLYVKNSNTSTSALYGVKSDMPSNATGLQTAYYSYVSGTGSGAHRGLYNYLTGAGTGIQAANYSLIDNSGNNIHYGNYSELSGGGSGLHYGNYLVISGTGTGAQFGENILISNSGNASHIGLRNTLSGSGSGLHIGTDNNLTGLGTGIQYGVKNTVDNSNTNTHYGVYNTLTGTGDGSRYGVYNTLTGTGGGSHYGTYNTLSGAGTGDQYGVQSSISNTGNGIHYAFRTDLSGTGSGTHLAMYNTISGSGAGNQYGVKTEITNSSTGIHYGNYASLSGSGSGSKYGTFNKIESTAGGTHYAVYGNATKAGSYAGYFVGDVNVSEKVLSDDSGDADMKAYIYGKITGTSSGASIVSTASSGGFSITRAAEGEYNVTFTNSPGSSSAYIVMTSFDRLEGYNPAISTVNYSSYFKIYTEVQTGLGGLVSHDFNFSFVVYKK